MNLLNSACQRPPVYNGDRLINFPIAIMQQQRQNQDDFQDMINDSSITSRPSLSVSMNSIGSSQRLFDRLDSSERETVALKAQVTQAFALPSYETDLNRTTSSKKTSVTSPNSARLSLAANHCRRISTNDDVMMLPNNDGPFSRPLPQVIINRSKSFQNNLVPLPNGPSSANNFDETMIIRSHKAHLDQILRKDPPSGYSDLRIPNYTSIDDVLKANEQLLLENDRLRSELNRLKTESILLLRSMRTANGVDPNWGNERIIAERERQELSAELARQVEENRRLRKSLLVQSDKFVKLRQSNSVSENPQAPALDHRSTPISVPQALLNASRVQATTKSNRFLLGNLGLSRPRTFNNGSHEPP